MLLYMLELGFLTIMTVLLLCHYASKSAPLYALVLVFLSLLVSFSCFLILPIDIYESATDPSSLDTVKTLWTTIYYVNFFLCWLILPFAQEFEDSGEFTLARRLRDSVMMNLLLIGALCVGALCIVIYLVVISSFTFAQLPGVFATLVNVFGLFLVSVLLGYGLVSFPKECFLRRNYKIKVSSCHSAAEVLKAEQEAILEEAFNIRASLQRDHARDIVEKGIILKLIEDNFKVDSLRAYDEGSAEQLAAKSNAALKKTLQRRILEHQANENQLDELVEDLKGITESYLKNNYSHKRMVYTALFGLTTLVSAIIFFAQISAFLPFLAPFNVLRLLGWDDESAYVWNSIITLYIAYIATHTIFRVKVYKVFSLHQGHSSASSLIFTAINLSRVCYPLCYNYLQISNISSASFLSFIGGINLNRQYAIVFPILMIVSGLFNLFDIYKKVLGYLGLSSFAFDDEEAQEKREEGRTILKERFNEKNIQTHRLQMIQLL